jgi:ATP-binding cassette subfamily C (CFTR/MRP) protein 1
MSLADNLIILEAGEILETGNPAQMLGNNGYISKLGMSLTSSNDTVEQTPGVTDIAIPCEASRKSTRETDKLLVEMRRKKGDFSVYKYYVASAGYVSVGIYVAACWMDILY